MRAFLVAVSICFALVAGGPHADAARRAHKAPPQRQMQDFASAEDILRWINGYRDEPQAARRPPPCRR